MEIGVYGCGFIGRIHARAQFYDLDLCNWIGGEPRLVMAQVSLAAKQSADTMRPVEIRPA
jgi:hypothetical protein